MLTEWKLSNFKSFYDETKLDLAPLTILTGKNSSGKSALIQSMLLIVQTLRNPIRTRSLILNGSLVKMGVLDEIQSDTGKEIGISFSFKKDIRSVNCSLGFISNEFLQNLKYEYSVIPEFQPIVDVLNKQDLTKRFIIAKRTETGDMIVESISNNIKQGLDLYGGNLKDIDGVKITLEHFLPGKFIFPLENVRVSKNMAKAVIRGVEKDFGITINEKILKKINQIEMEGDSAIMTKKLSNINQIKKESEATNSSLVSLAYFYQIANDRNEQNFKLLKELVNISEKEIKNGITSEYLLISNQFIRDFFVGSIKYLGPLRYKNALYNFSEADDLNDVGVSGENTASVIHIFNNNTVEFILPEENANITSSNSTHKKTTLKKALAFWLKYLGICNNINVKQLGKHGFLLKIKPLNINKPLDLTQVGTGVSQVLPVLVLGLLAEKDSTLLFEQPELHLHPKMQSRLADFFISMALLGKQCIIETHSEHIIDRLRLRICETLLKDKQYIKDITKIYFFNNDGSSTGITPIEINKYADYSVWPDGFFDVRQYISKKILKSIDEKMFSELDDDDLRTPDD